MACHHDGWHRTAAPSDSTGQRGPPATLGHTIYTSAAVEHL